MTSDMADKTVHLDMLLSNMLLSDKPFVITPVKDQQILDCLVMQGIAWGRSGLTVEKSLFVSLPGSDDSGSYSSET